MSAKPEAKELLRDLNAHVEKMQRIVAEYLPSNSGITRDEVLDQLIEMLDGPEQRSIQSAVVQLLGNPPALSSRD